MKKSLLIFGWVLASSSGLYGQNCSPEYLQRDEEHYRAGEFKGPKLQRELDTLMKEIILISEIKYEDVSQKNIFVHCASKKDTLFQNLTQNADPSVKDSSAYNEVVGDYSKFHNEYKQALLSYDRAVDMDPGNLNLLIKDYNAFALVENINLNQLSEHKAVAEESRRILEEAARRAQKISEHPQANKSYAIQSLVYRALVERGLDNTQQELDLWEKVLNLDPKNEVALRSRLNIYLNRADLQGSVEGFRRLQRESYDREADWKNFLEFLAANKSYDEYLSWYKRAPVGFAAHNPEFTVLQVRAFIELDRNDDAEKAEQSVPKKLNQKAALLSAQNKARLKELEGDKLKKDGRLSEALDAYQKALPNSPNPLTLREKISMLIYEYRKGLNFEPPAATLKDLQQVVDLLQKGAFESELKSSLFEIFLHSLKITKNNFLLGKACARYKSLYPELSAKYRDYCLSPAPSPQNAKALLGKPE